MKRELIVGARHAQRPEAHRPSLRKLGETWRRGRTTTVGRVITTPLCAATWFAWKGELGPLSVQVMDLGQKYPDIGRDRASQPGPCSRPWSFQGSIDCGTCM